MGHHRFFFFLAGLGLVGCGEPPSPEAPPTLSQYAQQFVDVESLLSSEAGVGVFYVHPIRKRACNTMQARVSFKDYDGLEHSWVTSEVLEIGEQNSAPVDRRNIGTHPVFFTMYEDAPHRIDAFSCTAYDGTVTTQYGNFAEFTVQPGKIAYIGDFTQARLAEGVNLYLPSNNFDAVREKIGLDSPALQSKLAQADITFFTFENFDGTMASPQDLLDNVGGSGDYFTLSQSLKTQAEEAMLPFLGYFPAFDVPPLTRLNVGSQKEDLAETMVATLNLAFLRLDMKAEFEAIIETKQSYQTARNHINHRLAVANTERQLEGITNTYSERSLVLASRNSIAVSDRNAFQKANGIAKIIAPLVTKEQREARENWKTQIERTAYVLTKKFSSNSQDTLLRDRIQRIMDDYRPAKYASLEIEFTQIAERQNKSAADMRRLRRLLSSANTNEEIILKELIANFMQENLAKNNDYHAARTSFEKNWIEIFEIIDVMQ